MNNLGERERQQLEALYQCESAPWFVLVLSVLVHQRASPLPEQAGEYFRTMDQAMRLWWPEGEPPLTTYYQRLDGAWDIYMAFDRSETAQRAAVTDLIKSQFLQLKVLRGFEQRHFPGRVELPNDINEFGFSTAASLLDRHVERWDSGLREQVFRWIAQRLEQPEEPWEPAPSALRLS